MSTGVNAARANGRKSQGPVTPEGKARTAANFNLLHESLVSEHLPASATECLIVHE